MNAHEVTEILHEQTFLTGVKQNQKLAKVLSSIRSGNYGNPGIFENLVQSLDSDRYLLHTDFDSYIQTLQKVEECFKDSVTSINFRENGQKSPFLRLHPWGNSLVTAPSMIMQNVFGRLKLLHLHK